RAQNQGQRDASMASESVGLTSHKSSCNCTGCGMLRAGVCINCAENIAAQILAQILESGPGELAVEPCSGACRYDRAVLLHAARALARAAHAMSGSKNARGETLIYRRRRNAHCWGECSSSYSVGAPMR